MKYSKLSILTITALVIGASFAIGTYPVMAFIALGLAAIGAVAHLGMAYVANPIIAAHKSDLMFFASLAIFAAFVLANTLGTPTMIAFVLGVGFAAHMIFAMLSLQRRPALAS
jgi:hypothetical protein